MWKWPDPETGFAREWGAAAVLITIELLLLKSSGVQFIVTPGAYCVAPLLWMAARITRGRRSLFLDFMALMIVTDLAIRVATYMAMATGGPLWDAKLAAADRALGFDWKAWFDYLVAHPMLGAPLGFFYYRIGLLALLLVVLLCRRGDHDNLRRMWRLLFTAGVLTALVGAIAPALGPFKTWHLEQCCGTFIYEMEKLRSGSGSFPLGSLMGVISYPSFHTTMALALVQGFRSLGRIGAAAGQLNLFLLLGVPAFGGHYLMDVFAGAGVFAAALVIVKAMESAGAANGRRPGAQRRAVGATQN